MGRLDVISLVAHAQPRRLWRRDASGFRVPWIASTASFALNVRGNILGLFKMDPFCWLHLIEGEEMSKLVTLNSVVRTAMDGVGTRDLMVTNWILKTILSWVRVGAGGSLFLNYKR